MIRRISIKSVASYDDTGVILDTNHRLNFLFGYNGSGKSTLARYLYDITLPESERNSQFEKCSIDGFSPISEDILVYDEDYKNRNFVLHDEQQGIFTLSEENEAIEKQIRELRKHRESLLRHVEINKSNAGRLQNIMKKREQILLDHCWNAKITFKAFVKANLKFPGNKKKQLDYVKGYLKKNETAKDISEISEGYQNLFEKGAKKVDELIDMYLFDRIVNVQEEFNKILSKVIIGNKDVDIANLIDELKIAQWVRQGMPYIDMSQGLCPFCQQPIAKDRHDKLKKMFELYFDKTYENDINKIKIIGKEYFDLLKSLIETLKTISRVYNPDLLITNAIDSLTDFKDKNRKIVIDKLDKPNELKSLEDIREFRINIESINKSISDNNKRCLELNKLKSEWAKQCWINLSESCRLQVETFENDIKTIESILNNISTTNHRLGWEIDMINQRITILQSQTINTNEAVNKINKLLKSVGFTGFELQEKGKTDSGVPTYFLKREGDTVTNVYRSLSEGEKTFISFLYFYHQCLGLRNANTVDKKKIIVIDDPVSSLDSQILFVISILFMRLALKNRQGTSIKKSFENPSIEQIFVLTHNFYFYKEITLKQRPLCADRQFFMVEKHGNVTHIRRMENTMKTDYALLWNSLKEKRDSLDDSDTTTNIFIANTMRRIIDSYVEFIGMAHSGKNVTWTALEKMEEGSEERIVGAALISLINDESHSMSPLDDIYYDNIVRRKPSLIFKAFEDIFKTIGEDHYNMMMGIP